jgi:hypothetical protein
MLVPDGAGFIRSPVREADRVGELPESALGQRGLELAEHPTGADGSPKIAVPTWTAAAPASTSSSASSPVRTPPTPMMGTAGSAR